MKDFFTVSVLKPKSTYTRIFANPHKVGISSLLLFVLGICYTFTVIVGYKNGFGAVVTPMLNIPPEKYYFYEAFFGIPVFFMIAVVFGGVTRLLSVIFKGEGSFENNFSVYCTSSIIPTLITMWLPETLLIVFFPDMRAQPLGGFEVLPIWADAVRQIAGVVWPMIVSIIGLSVSEKISYWKSTLISVIAFVICAGIMVIIIR